MKITSLIPQTINIAAVFSDKLKMISSEDLKNGLDIQSKEEIPYIETSSVRVWVFSSINKQIIVEPKRLLVYDTSGDIKDFSSLSECFLKTYRVLEPSNLKAYGFNFEILAEIDKIDYKNLIGENLLKAVEGDTILGAGNQLIYFKNKARYRLEIAPGEKSDIQMMIHFNIHYEDTNLPSVEKITERITENYRELTNIMGKFFS